MTTQFWRELGQLASSELCKMAMLTSFLIVLFDTELILVPESQIKTPSDNAVIKLNTKLIQLNILKNSSNY